MSRRRDNPPQPYWVVECPVTRDQGLIEAWITDRGRPAMACEVCHATWFDAGLEPGREVYPEDATGRLPDGDLIYVGRSRPATREELERLGWWSRISPHSRENDR